jgi:hypothetical protein
MPHKVGFNKDCWTTSNSSERLFPALIGVPWLKVIRIKRECEWYIDMKKKTEVKLS